MHQFTETGVRVRIVDEAHPMAAAIGAVARLRLDGQAWVAMRDVPPAELREFPLDDPSGRGRMIVLSAEQCQLLDEFAPEGPAAVIPVKVGRRLFQFDGFDDWVEHARPRFLATGLADWQCLCVDGFGRIVERGRDFLRAREEDAFPVIVYAKWGE